MMQQIKKYGWLLLTLCLTSCVTGAKQDYQIRVDPETETKIGEIISSVVIPDSNSALADRMVDVSASFLGTPYKANTLSGDLTTKEILVADFTGVDCFTLIDYIYALSLSASPEDFLPKLVNTRYVDGKVDYLHRKHFFSDWYATRPVNAEDVTAIISSRYVTARKNLNRKANGEEFIAGLGVIPREIKYIPAKFIDETVLNNLKNGDLIGVYTPQEGLDVTHVGIVVKEGNMTWFRNASSLDKNMKVVDTPLLEYMKTMPGIVVLRTNQHGNDQ